MEAGKRRLTIASLDCNVRSMPPQAIPTTFPLIILVHHLVVLLSIAVASAFVIAIIVFNMLHTTKIKTTKPKAQTDAATSRPVSHLTPTPAAPTRAASRGYKRAVDAVKKTLAETTAKLQPSKAPRKPQKPAPAMVKARTAVSKPAVKKPAAVPQPVCTPLCFCRLLELTSLVARCEGS